MTAVPRAAITRRRVLAGALLIVPALAGCSLGAADEPPDPLIALADAARADVALATAAIAADPQLADRVRPLVDARTAHAAALDAEVARLAPDQPPNTPRVPAAFPTRAAGGAGSTGPGLTDVRTAVESAGAAAATVALGLPADRVGLVASVAACCTTYAVVLA